MAYGKIARCLCGQMVLFVPTGVKTHAAGSLQVLICDKRFAACTRCGRQIELPPVEVLDEDRRGSGNSPPAEGEAHSL